LAAFEFRPIKLKYCCLLPLFFPLLIKSLSVCHLGFPFPYSLTNGDSHQCKYGGQTLPSSGGWPPDLAVKPSVLVSRTPFTVVSDLVVKEDTLNCR
ncbi:hypothetical protein ERO13_D08G269550v2, partial [Gossypium hirsutum]